MSRCKKNAAASLLLPILRPVFVCACLFFMQGCKPGGWARDDGSVQQDFKKCFEDSASASDLFVRLFVYAFKFDFIYWLDFCQWIEPCPCTNNIWNSEILEIIWVSLFISLLFFLVSTNVWDHPYVTPETLESSSQTIQACQNGREGTRQSWQKKTLKLVTYPEKQSRAVSKRLLFVSWYAL